MREGASLPVRFRTGVGFVTGPEAPSVAGSTLAPSSGPIPGYQSRTSCADRKRHYGRRALAFDIEKWAHCRSYTKKNVERASLSGARMWSLDNANLRVVGCGIIRCKPCVRLVHGALSPCSPRLRSRARLGLQQNLADNRGRVMHDPVIIDHGRYLVNQKRPCLVAQAALSFKENAVFSGSNRFDLDRARRDLALGILVFDRERNRLCEPLCLPHLAIPRISVPSCKATHALRGAASLISTEFSS